MEAEEEEIKTYTDRSKDESALSAGNHGIKFDPLINDNSSVTSSQKRKFTMY